MHPSPVAVQNVGWTWTATIGVVQTIIIAIFGAGGSYGIARGVALLWKTSNDAKKQDTDAAAAVRKEMVDITVRQNDRITKLENDLRDERRQYDAELAALRKSHVEEIADLHRQHAVEIKALRDQIEGLNRQMMQMQQTTGRAIRNGVNAPASGSRMGVDAEGIGEALRQTFGLPGTGESV